LIGLHEGWSVSDWIMVQVLTINTRLQLYHTTAIDID